MTIGEFINEWTNNSDYITAHTSGSTGAPKAVNLLKADMRASARVTNDYFNITSASRMLLCLSPAYIAGKMMIVRAMESGAELVGEEPSNDILANYSGEAFDLIAAVPSQVAGLLSNPERLKYVRQLLIGGSAVSPEMEAALVNAGVNTYASYGMTETCSHIALRKLGDERNFTAVGSVTFSVDERQCLCAKVPHLSVGEVRTNDIVELLSPTEFRWIGRFDNVINTGGIKVFPEEIERKIAGMIDSRFYISSQPSDKWGEEVVLVLEKEDISREAKAAMLSMMKDYLSPFQRPKEIICIKQFEETSSGKVKRTRTNKAG